MKKQGALITLSTLLLLPLIVFGQHESETEMVNIFEEQAHASRFSLNKSRKRKQDHVKLPYGQKEPILLHWSVPTDFLPAGEVYWNNNNFPLMSIDPMKFYQGPLPTSIYYVPKEGFRIISSSTSIDPQLPVPSINVFDLNLR